MDNFGISLFCAIQMRYNRDMPDVKKLITGFLIIAIAASSAALILSVGGPNNSLTALQNPNAPVDAANQNAFVPTQADVLAAATQDAPDVAAELNDPKNLTTNFTNAFLDGLSAANPTGIQQDTSGNIQFNSPDVQVLAQSFKNNPVLKSIPLPNWDAEVSAQQLKISSSANLSDYSNTLNAVFNKDFVQSGAQSLVGQQDVDISNIAALSAPLQDAAQTIIDTPTPANLSGFQKSLVATLIFQKNMVDLGALGQTDPVKASIVFQAEQARYNQVWQDFETQYQKAVNSGVISLNVESKPSNGLVAFVNNYLSIPTAHAQWIDWGAFGHWIESEIENVVLQILKNTLTAFIQQRVLKWIQGSGAPMFVQQFGTQLVNVAQAQAMASVASILPGYKYTCPNIGNLLGPTIGSLGLTVPPAKQVPTCSLTVSPSQLTNFYKNFSFSGINTVPGGSWGLYAQILNPSNNYYGALLQSQDYVNQQSAAAAQVAQTKQVANQGFSPQVACDDGSDPNGTSTLCDDQTQPTNQWVCTDHSTPTPISLCDGAPTIPGTTCSGVSTTKYHCTDGNFATYQAACKDGSQPTQWDNNGECTDGSEPRTTTPGQVTGQATYTALGGSVKLITSANSPLGLLASLATSLLNTLVQGALSAAVQKGTQGLTAITLSATAGGASTNGGAAPEQPAQPTGGPSLPATQCYPHTPNCTSGAGGQCGSGYMAGTITFSATGGDGLDYTWSVGIPHDANGVSIELTANPNSAGTADASSTGIFSTYFTDPTGLIQPTVTDPVFPITIPVNVTGSDGTSDTCLAVITQ